MKLTSHIQIKQISISERDQISVTNFFALTQNSC